MNLINKNKVLFSMSSPWESSSDGIIHPKVLLRTYFENLKHFASYNLSGQSSEDLNHDLQTKNQNLSFWNFYSKLAPINFR